MFIFSILSYRQKPISYNWILHGMWKVRAERS